MVARKLILLFTLFNSIYAQNGGLNTFNFMQFSNSARVEALGGYTLALSDDDATLGISNPASINIAEAKFAAEITMIGLIILGKI